MYMYILVYMYKYIHRAYVCVKGGYVCIHIYENRAFGRTFTEQNAI